MFEFGLAQDRWKTRKKWLKYRGLTPDWASKEVKETWGLQNSSKESNNYAYLGFVLQSLGPSEDWLFYCTLMQIGTVVEI